MKINLKTISVIVFYGAIWGIVEASVGYVLHFLPALIAGTILFPFASLILYKTYKQTNSNYAVLGVGVIAAMIKAVNFLLPVTNIFKVINPMISILLEALVVMVVMRSFVKSNWVIKTAIISIASITWRMLFLGYMGIQAITTGFVAVQIGSLEAILSFSVVSGLLSAMMSIGLLFIIELPNKLKKPMVPISPILSLVSLAVAVILTILL
ncbi:MAG: hypothetical protein CVV56_01545 [Tenericutes bacterium HGW-Tenericutes-1]|jgi:hypothetical protein|nr:MAG: hypothetical protein CVV56_01545 [Tenericutes bacterium HGW-Tenericutes-1]